jgi:hypothetical protein
MFGRGNWEPAQAKILDTRIKNYQGDGIASIDEFAAEITPASGAAFRTVMKPPTIATDFWAPKTGDVVNVLADVEQQKAKFDKSEPKTSYKAQEAAKEASFKANLQPPPA